MGGKSHCSSVRIRVTSWSSTTAAQHAPGWSIRSAIIQQHEALGLPLGPFTKLLSRNPRLCTFQKSHVEIDGRGETKASHQTQRPAPDAAAAAAVASQALGVTYMATRCDVIRVTRTSVLFAPAAAAVASAAAALHHILHTSRLSGFQTHSTSTMLFSSLHTPSRPVMSGLLYKLHVP
ncbi:hypothetical protein IWZ01DRAFT_308302 [Phyllosticta capitalensis]